MASLFTDSLVLIPLGICAGMLTTVAGIGGGMVLVVALSLATDAQRALATTAPALLVGNFHRLLLFRRHVERPLAARFVAGALPASLLGGFLAVVLPSSILSWLLLAVTLVAAAKQLGLVKLTLPPSAAVLAGASSGVVTATTGGGGLLVGPFLLAAGLRGEAFVATGAAVAFTMHIGRIVAYGVGGLFNATLLGQAALLAVSILAGNLVGRRVRGGLTEVINHRITWVTLAGLVLLAFAGVT